MPFIAGQVVGYGATEVVVVVADNVSVDDTTVTTSTIVVVDVVVVSGKYPVLVEVGAVAVTDTVDAGTDMQLQADKMSLTPYLPILMKSSMKSRSGG